LFTGTRGVGKTTAARILAKALNCEQGPTPKPCNQCDSCNEISAGVSMDVLEIDGASNTGVDNVRELRETVKFLPAKSRHKIYIIDEVHMLSTPAFNALLKTLEEPPPHVIFIFATTDPHKIPDTILSRCQQYDFKTIPLRMIYDHLKDLTSREKISLTDEHLMLIARKAEGSIRDGLSLLDQAISYGGEAITTEELMDILGIVDRGILFDLSGAILEGDAEQCLEVLGKISGFSYDTRRFYFDLLEHFRNLAVARVSEAPTRLIEATGEEVERYVAQAAPHSGETLQFLFEMLVRGEDEALKSSNPALVLEMILLRMATAPSMVPLGELLASVRRLQSELGVEEAAGPAEAPPRSEKRVERKPQSTPAPKTKPKAKPEKAKAPEPEVIEPETPEPEAIEPEAAEAKARPEVPEDPDIKKAWEAVLEGAEAKRSDLSAVIDQGRPIRLDGGRLTVEFDGLFPYNTLAQNEENRAFLAGLVKEAFGEKTEIDLVLCKKKGRGKNAQEDERDREKRKQREVLENQTVRDVLELFDGEITQVVVDRDKG